MSYTRADVDTAVVRILRDDAGEVTQTQRYGFYQVEAVQLFSKHRPLEKVADLTADGTYDYTLNTTNFPSWTDGFSRIKKVEYPAGEYQDPAMTPFEEWMIYETSTTKYLRFTDTTPTTGYTIRVRYTVPHSVPATGNITIYDNDFGAFCNLCASMCAQSLANYFSEHSDSTIGADAVAYREKSDQWSSRAKELYKAYISYMFPEHIGAAMAFREFDTTFAELGLSRLTHKAWTR